MIYQYQIFKEYKKGMDRSNKKKILMSYTCIIANTSVIWGESGVKRVGWEWGEESGVG